MLARFLSHNLSAICAQSPLGFNSTDIGQLEVSHEMVLNSRGINRLFFDIGLPAIELSHQNVRFHLLMDLGVADALSRRLCEFLVLLHVGWNNTWRLDRSGCPLISA